MSQIPEETVFTYTDSSNPQLRLLEEAFEGLEPEERIKRISDMLLYMGKCGRDDERAVGLVRSLKVCFERNLVAYRAHLRHAYLDLEYSSYDGVLYSLRVPNVRERIFEEVVMGWSPRTEDAQACFTFLCDVFSVDGRPALRGPDAKLRRIILDVFRKHLENSYKFTVEELIPWACSEETPDEIAKNILHGMVNTKDGTRLAGVTTMREILTVHQAAR